MTFLRQYSIHVSFLLVCGLSPTLVQAQRSLAISSEYLTHRDGLNLGITYDGISQDRFGRVWVAGEKNIACFDGSRIQLYGASDSLKTTGLKAVGFQSVAKDAEGQLWVSGSSGLYRYDFWADTFCLLLSPQQDGTWSKSQRFLVSDTLRRCLWLIDKDGLFGYSLADKSWKKIPLPPFAGKVRYFGMLRNGNLLLSGLDAEYAS